MTAESEPTGAPVTHAKQPKIRVKCQWCDWAGYRLDWWPSLIAEEKPCPVCGGEVKVG